MKRVFAPQMARALRELSHPTQAAAAPQTPTHPIPAPMVPRGGQASESGSYGRGSPSREGPGLWDGGDRERTCTGLQHRYGEHGKGG